MKINIDNIPEGTTKLKNIPLKPAQINMLKQLAIEKESVLRREKEMIDFLMAGHDIDPATVLSMEIRDNDVLVQLR